MKLLRWKKIPLLAALFGALGIITAQAQPTVNLTVPASGASFAAPANLALTATTTDSGGTVTNVAFYQGTTLLGKRPARPSPSPRQISLPAATL